LALSLFACVGAFGAVDSASAQDAATEEDPQSSRAATFRAVSGPQAERVPGGLLTVIAYGGAWVLVLGYLWRLGRMHAQNERELSALKKSLESNAP
jgi:CcmD family protein